MEWVDTWLSANIPIGQSLGLAQRRDLLNNMI